MYYYWAKHPPIQDPTNLQGKVQKHATFESELTANVSRIENVTECGEQLIADEHYASDIIQEHIDELTLLWKKLLEQSTRKGFSSSFFNLN